MRTAVTIAALVAFAAPAAARGTMCLAPSDPANAGKPLAELASLEFYLDNGNPLIAYTVPFARLSSGVDANGHTVNRYGISGAASEGASIEFLRETPLTVTIAEMQKTFVTLVYKEKDSEFMADAIPGIGCWTVDVEAP
jgi:hypothetical protein